MTAPDGFELSVQVTGHDNAPPLLLLQGQANSHRWWTCLREAFDPTFRVITFDYRGTGASRGPVGPWTTSSFAEDAAHVLASLGIGAAAVYGTSMGGRIAQLLAAEHPHCVERLVLACTSPGGPHALERSHAVRRSLADSDAERRLLALHRLFYTDAWPHPPERRHLLGDGTMTADERRAHLRASDKHDAWDALPAITAPTLVLHGSADAITPVANASLLADRIPGASLFVHPEGRHGFFEEFANDITPRVLAFL